MNRRKPIGGSTFALFLTKGGGDGGRASFTVGCPEHASLRVPAADAYRSDEKEGILSPVSGATRSRPGRSSATDTAPRRTRALGSAAAVPAPPWQPPDAVAPYAAWPVRLAPKALHRRGLSTPFLAIDAVLLRQRVHDFRAAFEGRVEVRYAVKCNPLPGVLEAV